MLLSHSGKGERVFFFIGAVSVFVFFAAPFVWMIATSLKNNSGLFEHIEGLGGLIAWPPVWENYVTVFTKIPFIRYLANSAFVAISSALLESSIACLAAYGLGVLQWRYRRAAYRVFFIAWLVPFSVVLIPRFLIMAYLPDWLWGTDFWSAPRVLSAGGVELHVGRLVGLDSFFALVLPGSISITATFLLMTAMRRIPSQLLEMACLDLVKPGKVFLRVVLPLVWPTLVTVAFFAFLSAWQAFTWPLVVTSNLSMQTANLGLRAFQSLHSTQWSLLMAGSVVLTLPSLGLLFLAQRYVIDRFQMNGLYEGRM